jgi:hypothetical protein
MKFEKVGDIVSCVGDGFKYERTGYRSHFIQLSKVPSLRIIRTMIKELEKLSNIKEV